VVGDRHETARGSTARLVEQVTIRRIDVGEAPDLPPPALVRNAGAR
jgi:hypothetical protein